MTNILMIIAALVLLIGGFIIYNYESSTIAQDTTSTPVVNDAKTQTADTEPNTIEPREINTNTPVIANTKTLDLSNQGLKKVPGDTFNQTEIQELNVANNFLDGSLQAEVRNLQNLKVLNLSNNNFTGVPAEIGQLQNLEVLDLSNNNLTGLPYELGNLSNLKALNLKGNNYSTADLNIIKQKLSSAVVIETD